ncbi:MAG: restriction endonuclease subunit S [Gammaproteobacteria bacterium]|nr:restriction endonuclease subunit S [Gammaproteobacteria bacterium]MDE0246822.1 restriction endonuclease subunit S [Gammaproteobacteria bacterium]
MTLPIVPLGQLCDMDRKGIDPEHPDATELPLLGVENVGANTGTLDLNSGSRTGDGKSTSFRFDARHVLYAKLRPYLNKVATPDFVGRCSTELVPLLPRPGIDRDFLAYLLRREKTVAFVMSSVTGARMPRTDMNVLMSMRVPLPPPDEQQRIVDILHRAARIERLRAKAAECFREFVPALFIKMFGDPVTNPMGWELQTLGNCCVQIRYGTSRKADGRGEGVPVLRMGNVTYRGAIDLTDLKHVSLSDGEMSKYGLQPGDILFNRTNSRDLVGKTGLWDGRFAAVAASYFIRLRLDESRVLPGYVWAAMNSAAMKGRLFAMARGAIGQANINARELGSIPLPLPDLELQTRFVKVMNNAVALRDMGRQSSCDAVALSASLLDGLLNDAE